MGVVYMAEQKEPVQRRVALKIIKPGMDTRQVIARFEAERQALAMMDHPNIAKVLDAGTTESGRPYFVMELVNGIPVTQYCDEQHLTARERLELFIPVCQAVQHAHQKGIIHRDIKPQQHPGRALRRPAGAQGHRLRRGQGHRPAADREDDVHGLGQIVGTIEYMSPEQAKRNQLDIDTRSDIYSLGVLLYELLTGDTPFDKQRLRSAASTKCCGSSARKNRPSPAPSSAAVTRCRRWPRIARSSPAKLSALVRGELDWIVMKALEKDRTRRYETANGLASDIQHYLNDEPVVACPPSAAYRFRKFARRNKAAMVTTGIVAAAMLVGRGGRNWQAIRATRAEGVAIAERDEKEAARREACSREGTCRAEAEAQQRKLAETAAGRNGRPRRLKPNSGRKQRHPKRRRPKKPP